MIADQFVWLEKAPSSSGNGVVPKISDFERDLEIRGLITRAYSAQETLVMEWLAKPSTYPPHFKGRRIFLWKSKKSTPGIGLQVAYLEWKDCRVGIYLRPFVFDCHPDDLALLHSPA